MSKPKAEVTKITITVGEHKFALTALEARALKDELNKLLGETVRIPYFPPSPARQPFQWPLDRPRDFFRTRDNNRPVEPPPWKHGDIICRALESKQPAPPTFLANA